MIVLMHSNKVQVIKQLLCYVVLLYAIPVVKVMQNTTGLKVTYAMPF